MVPVLDVVATVVVPVAAFVVVVVVSCARASVTAATQATPAANIFTNLVSFMFFLCFG
jgi:hypothetical protein